MPALHPGPAGRALSNGIATTPGLPGFVFVSTGIALDVACYRLTLTFDRGSFVSNLADGASGFAFPSGLVLDVAVNGHSLGMRPIAVDELARGTLAVEFRVQRPADATQGAVLRLFSSGRIGLAVNGASVEEIQGVDAAADIATFNYTRMLAVGPAGRRQPTSTGGARPIETQLGIAGWLVHCGDNDVHYTRPKRKYDGRYNSFWLPPGKYEARFKFSVTKPVPQATIGVYVLAEAGNVIFAKGSLTPNRFGAASSSLLFEVGERMPTREDGLLEFLVWTDGRAGFSLTGLHIHEASPGTQVVAAVAVARKGILGEFRSGNAGFRLPDSIVTVPGAFGPVFLGSAQALVSARYRLSLEVCTVRLSEQPTGESGLYLGVFDAEMLVAYREIPLAELQVGQTSIDFRVVGTEAKTDVRIEFRLWTLGLVEAEFRSANVEKLPVAVAPESLGEFDSEPLLSIGPAGEQKRAPGSQRGSIHAKPGESGNVSHGPFIWLPAGAYEARFEFYVERGASVVAGKVDVVSDLGANVLAQGTFSRPKNSFRERMMHGRWERTEVALTFKIPTVAPRGDSGRLEFRTWSIGECEFYLTALRVKRREALSGAR